MQSPEIPVREGPPLAVTVVCFIAVLFTSQFNLILGLLCWGLLEKMFGGYFADNSGGLLYLLLAAAQTGLYALIWLPSYALSRRLSAGLGCAVVIAVTVLYLGFWLGWTAWAYAEMARTGGWL